MAKEKKGRNSKDKKTLKKKPLDDDTACTGSEDQWYDATSDSQGLNDYCEAWAGTRWLDMLDVFSFHEGMKQHAGSRTVVSLDIRLNPVHDLTTKRGMMLLLSLLMALKHGALLALAPPCSLFIWLSCSIHLRHALGPYGNLRNLKVRMANRIVLNTAPRLAHMFRFCL